MNCNDTCFRCGKKLEGGFTCITLEYRFATLVDMEHFTWNNFRIIELSPAEVLAEVD